MIHYTREGRPFKIGLNITFGVNERWWPWFTLIWVWYRPADMRLIKYRFRLRTWKLKCFWNKDVTDVITHYLGRNDMFVVSREFLEDLWLLSEDNVFMRAFLQRHKLLERLNNNVPSLDDPR